ncbi:MAG: hypothetical protein JWP94_1739 [Mucilaginibacter sp.]|jgi:hypothetical protein|nr:hypothetical protein [Mucilaginibacter sp.]
MKKLIGLLLFLSIAATAFSQKQEKPLVQFTGIVHNADSARVTVPYVSITNTSYQNQVNLSDYRGYFSFVVHELDTIRFTSIGYAPLTVVIPANLPAKSYTLQVSLKPQIINLPVFRVFPWATTEEFRKDFLSMKIADDDLEIAKKNLSRSSIQTLERTLPRDGLEMNSFQDFHNNVLNSHSITNPLLNPFSWGSLIKQIAAGDKSSTASGN